MISSSLIDYDVHFGQNVNIYYREVIPDEPLSQLTLLLLHGMKFSSATWVDIKTLQVISSLGYRVVAVDLPNFGRSSKTSNGIPDDSATFLSNMIKALGISQPVIVSPSFSGMTF